MLLQTLESLTHSDYMALPRILYYNIVEFYVRGLEKYQVIKKGNTSFTFKAVISQQFNKDRVIKKIDEWLREILQKEKMFDLSDPGIIAFFTFYPAASASIPSPSPTGSFPVIR